MKSWHIIFEGRECLLMCGAEREREEEEEARDRTRGRREGGGIRI